MRRKFMIAAALVLVVGTTPVAYAQRRSGGASEMPKTQGPIRQPIQPSTELTTNPAAPYKLNAAGKCQAANGRLVAASMCKDVQAGPYKVDAKGRCYAANGQFVAASRCRR